VALDAAARDGSKNLSDATATLRTALSKEVSDLGTLVEQLYAVVEGRINSLGRK
jgi:hypothetical protein